MGAHPINLLIRFLLEIIALITMGIWGWHQATGALQYLLAIGIPLLFTTLWGVFAVPDDPSRTGKAPVPVPGWLRLVFELVFFAFASWGMYQLDWLIAAMIFGGIVVIHYIVSYDRIQWLLRK